MTDETLLPRANAVYHKHFPPIVTFERAVFFSWGCAIGDCTFCYMSTQPKEKVLKETKRSAESMLAEFMLAKELGWDIGFFTGGIGVLSYDEMELLLKQITAVTKEKIWLSVGPLPKVLLQRFSPYIKGVVGSTETVNRELHKKVCPSKPLEPYEKMFESAKELDLQRAMTFIVGMGETRDDLNTLIAFIKKYDITKIHVYGLIPQKGTMFEHSPIPSPEEQAWWIANLRINFPTLDIQCGVWEDRAERISLLLKAGANSISKFKAIKLFGTPVAKEFEHQAELADRKFQGTLTQLPKVDWQAKVAALPFDEVLKQKVAKKLLLYVKEMEANCSKLKVLGS